MVTGREPEHAVRSVYQSLEEEVEFLAWFSALRCVCLYWDPLEANSTGSLCQCSSRSSPSPAGVGNNGAITSVVLLSQALCEMPCRGPSLLHWDPVSLGLWALHVTELKGIAVFYKRLT